MVALWSCFGERLRVGWDLCALVNPALQKRDLGGLERRTLGRHRGDLLVVADDRLDEPAFGAFARDDRRPTIASFQERSRAIEPQA